MKDCCKSSAGRRTRDRAPKRSAEPKAHAPRTVPMSPDNLVAPCQCNFKSQILVPMDSHR